MNNLGELLKRLQAGQATEEELNELRAWIETNPDALLENLEDDLETALDSTHADITQADEALKARALGIRNKILTLPAGKQRNINSFPWTKVAAAVTLILMATAWILYRTPADPAPAITAFPQKILSGKQFLRLPDGTRVTMNDLSMITYDGTFGDSVREVTLKGEAYFDVAHNPARPFIVHAGDVFIRVLGTAFNVRQNNADSISVTVMRGRVEVGQGTHAYGQLLPDEQMTINTTGHQFSLTKADSNTALRWTQQFLILDAVTMTEAAKLISDHFNTRVLILNKDLEKCIVSGTFLHGEDLRHVVEVLTQMSGGQFTITPQQVTISGGSCK